MEEGKRKRKLEHTKHIKVSLTKRTLHVHARSRVDWTCTPRVSARKSESDANEGENMIVKLDQLIAVER